MNWLSKLERKFGRYAVPNLSRYFVFAIVIGFLGELTAPSLMSFLEFSPAAICHGQIWRLLTWVFIPATGMDFFGILFLVCVLMWGSSLESLMGTFGMNVFLVQGILISDIGAMLIYVVSWAVTGTGIPVPLTTYYILFSILLAIAICIPEGEVRIYFVFPIKMKWMLLFELLYMAYVVYSYFRIGLSVLPENAGGREVIAGLLLGLALSSPILLAIGSMFLFFWFSKTRLGRKQRKRQKEFRRQFSEARPGSGITMHKCAVCGRTEEDAPNMVFRYCSKCSGNLEYCEEHLFTHRHIL